MDWKQVWQAAEWASHIETLVRNFWPGASATSTDEEHISKEAKGMRGRYGWGDERALIQSMNALTPVERKRDEEFHANYYVGHDFFSQDRAKERFSEYRTVLADMAGSSHSRGKRKTTSKFHRRPVDHTMGDGGSKAPYDTVERVVDEDLFIDNPSQAVLFLKHLAKELGKAELAASKRGATNEERLADMKQAGHMVLKGAGMPCMPEPGEKDWRDALQYSVKHAPEIVAYSDEAYRAMQDDTACRRAGLSRTKRLLHNILPF